MKHAGSVAPDTGDISPAEGCVCPERRISEDLLAVLRGKIARSIESLRLFLIYLKGFALVLAHAVTLSVMMVWVLQFAALAFGETYDWGAVLVHLILSIYFLMLFPGQQVWTVRLEDSAGRVHTIVGAEQDHTEA